MPLQIKCASWEWEFASLFLARLPSVNKLSSFIWERRKRSSLLLSCLLLGFYVVRYVRTETVNYGKWALMLAFRSKQYYRCQVSQAKKKGASLLPFPAHTEELHLQKCSSRESLDVLAWGTCLLIFMSEVAKFFCGAEPGWSLTQSDFFKEEIWIWGLKERFWRISQVNCFYNRSSFLVWVLTPNRTYNNHSKIF